MPIPWGTPHVTGDSGYLGTTDKVKEFVTVMVALKRCWNIRPPSDINREKN